MATLYSILAWNFYAQAGWNSSVATVVLWTIAFITPVVALVIMAVKRRYRRSLAEKEHQSSILRQRLAEMEMKVLRSQMNPHFIFNSLNSINRYIVKSDAETASAYLTKFGKLIRLILENSHHRVIPLEQELNALKLYIELEALRFNGKFNYSIRVSEGVDVTTFGIPPLVLQPFVENAIWHGLLHKEQHGMLSVEVGPSETGIHCVIQDNGIGRKKAAELRSKSINTDKSFGLKITTERITGIKSRSAVEIEDLTDEFGNAAGTRVTLVISQIRPEDY